MATSAATATNKIRSWREYPAQFVYEQFNVEPDRWQLKALESLGGDYRETRRLVMKACTGPGKSAVLSWIGWHRLSCFAERKEHPKGAALSITKDNLKDNLWAEMAKWQSRSEFLQHAFTWTKERIYATDYPETWFLAARSYPKDADQEALGRALSGLHSMFPFVLLDETGDMPVALGRIAEQIFTGGPKDALIAAAGNPTSVKGLLYHLCQAMRELWEVITVTADPDDPDRTPRVTVEHARKMIETHGKDNPWVMATILGLFPAVGFNNLLGLDEVEEAMSRAYEEDVYSFAAKILGVDVARQGDDQSVIFPRQGLQAFMPQAFRNLRSHQLAGYTKKKYDDWQADGVIVDGTGGWGAGVIDALETLGLNDVHDCQFSGKAYDKRYFNKRAEIHFLLAEWVRNGGALPRHPRLLTELTTITYTFKGDKFMVTPKDIFKEEMGFSPDFTDGIAVTFAEPIQKRDMLQHMINSMGPPGGQKEWHPLDDLRK